MPQYHMRLRQTITTIELVDVAITANSPEEAQEKIENLLRADEVRSADDTDFGEALDSASWEHNSDSEGWEFVQMTASLLPPKYQGDAGPVDLDVYTPVDEDEEEGEE